MDEDRTYCSVEKRQQFTNLEMKRMTDSQHVQYRDLFPEKETNMVSLTTPTMFNDITKSSKDSTVDKNLPVSQTQTHPQAQNIRVLNVVVNDNNDELPFTDVFTSYGPIKLMFDYYQWMLPKGTIEQLAGRVCRGDKPIQIIVDSSSLKESWAASLSSHSQFYHSSLSPISPNEKDVDNTIEPLQQYDDTDEHMQQVD